LRTDHINNSVLDGFHPPLRMDIFAQFLETDCVTLHFKPANHVTYPHFVFHHCAV